MTNQTKYRRALAAVCSCGGWVMVAAMGHGPESDADNYREAADCIAKGFEIRHGSVGEIRELAMCEHRGRCLSGRVPVLESDLEAKGQERLEL